ncbi:MAG: response regulator [Desulfobacteraceae bacterium]|nr:response regulator [Desulfobacteraceae bacterium]
MNTWERIVNRWHKLGITHKFSSAFGVLLALILMAGVTGYVGLAVVRHRTETTILTSTKIQQLVLEMDNGLQRARRLERDFFFQYPAIGFSDAYRIYAQKALEEIAHIIFLSAQLNQIISESDVSKTLRGSNININLFLTVASRYEVAFGQMLELVSRLAEKHIGLQEQMEEHSSLLRKSLREINYGSMILYLEMKSFEKDYWLKRKRPFMQSAFNVGWKLRKSIELTSTLGREQKTRIMVHLNNYLMTAEKILQTDVAILQKKNEFNLQAETIDPISRQLIALSAREVEHASAIIKRTSTMASVILAATVLVGLILAGIVARILNNSITSNVIRLTDVAGKLHSGNLEVRAQTMSHDELGVLADSFNAMASRISSLVGSLEKKVDERTNELTISNLKLQEEIKEHKRTHNAMGKAKLEAVAATEAKSNFLANMSHEIRTPMNAIIGLSDLALRNDMSFKLRDYLSKISTSAHSLLGIINDILDFSKIEAGKLDMESIAFNLDDIIDNLMSVLNVKAEEKGLELLLDIKPAVPRGLVGDPLRLVQVLTNLVNNAVKFTKAGHIIISADIPNGIQDNRSNKITLEFKVVDTGIGMSLEQTGQLFKSFSQVNGSITRRFGGTGLGLVISKHLVEMMDGEIRVDSEPGKGSAFSFTVRLGVADPLERKDITAAGTTTQKIEGLDRIRGARILLVEDNELNRQVAMELLENAGFWVFVATNGEEALQMVAESTFDTVLMDVNMPVMDGFTATGVIRHTFDADALPIIAMTAHAISGYREKCLDSGMDDYVTKPIDPKELFSTLAKWIKPGERELPEARPDLSDEDSDLPETLAGIDIQAGLENVGGNRAFYRKILPEFLRINQNTVSDIHSAVENADMETAGRLAHTLKGMAGNIGADDLYQSVTVLETAFRNEDLDRAGPLLDDVSRDLSMVLDAIRQLADRSRYRKMKEQKPMELSMAGPVEKPAMFPGIRVLLAEDNPLNQMVAVEVLKHFGCVVEICPNGREAISMFRKNDYDIVLMDVHMPVMDGFEATGQIREIEGDDSHMPIVAMTALAMKGDMERCIEVGMDDYIAKPIRKHALYSVLEKYFSTEERSASHSEAPGVIDHEKALLNPEILMEISDADPEIIDALIHEFIKNAPPYMESLEEAVEQNDDAMIFQRAHRLRGLVAHAGGEQAEEYLLEIETHKRSGQTIPDIIDLKPLKENLELLIEALKETDWEALCSNK